MRAQTLKLIYGVDPILAYAGSDGVSVGTEVGPGFVQAPLYPPIDWFTDEAADAAPSRLTIYPDGRYAGIVAPAGRCLLDGSGTCWTVPRPADGRGSRLCSVNDLDGNDYDLAHYGNGGTICADGTEIATATIAGSGGHANPFHGIGQAKDHYDNPDWQVGRHRYVWSDTAGNGVGGVVAVGSLWPEVTERQTAAIRASACSVDYRWIIDEGQYRLIATCLVNVGGLPARIAAAIEQGWVVTPEDLNELAAEIGPAMVASAGITFDPADYPGSGVPSHPNAATLEDPHMTLRPNTITPAGAGAAAAAGTAPIPAAVTAAAEGAPATVIEDAAAHTAPCSCQATPAAVTAATDSGQAPAEGEPARQAAYALVDIESDPELAGLAPNYRYNDQISWDNNGTPMVGAYSDTMRAWDGSVMVAVIPDSEGVLDYDNMVLVPAAMTTATGKLYEYIDPRDLPYDAVVATTPDVVDEVWENESKRWDAEYCDVAYCCSASPGARLAAGRRITSPQPVTEAEAKIAAVERKHEAQMAAVQAQLGEMGGTVHNLASARRAAELAAL